VFLPTDLSSLHLREGMPPQKHPPQLLPEPMASKSVLFLLLDWQGLFNRQCSLYCFVCRAICKPRALGVV
jgi:hypothetical protein